jgi:hypothetical protein
MITNPRPTTVMEQHERSRIRAAARHARRVYPGPVGELLHRELNAYADFGVRFSGDGLIPQLAAHVLRLPLPTREVSA